MNRVMRFVFVVLAIVILSACSQNQPQSYSDDAIKLSLEAEQSIVNATLKLAIAVTGEGVSAIDLLMDGNLLETLKAPYTYTWDTSKEKEGQHTLQAKVTRDDIFVSNQVNITVDRTAPSISQVTPQVASPSEMFKRIDVTFSEAVDTRTINAANVSLTKGGDLIKSQITLSSDKKELSILPETIQAPVTFNLRLKGIKDLADNILEETVLPFEISRPVDYEGSLNQDLGKSVLDYDLAFDSRHHPIVMFSEQQPETIAAKHIYVKSWTDDGWKSLGGMVSSENGYATPLEIIVDATDHPIISYIEHATVDDLINGETPSMFIKRWNGSAWQKITQVLDDAYGFSKLELSLDNKHRLSLYEGDRVVIKQWQNNSWVVQKTIPLEILPMNESASLYVQSSSLDIDVQGNPVLAWFEYDGSNGSDGGLFVKRWTGSSWEMLGQSISIQKTSWVSEVILELDADNNPIVVWTEVDDDSDVSVRQLYLKRWTGSVWESLVDGSLNVNRDIDAIPTQLELSSGDPLLSWSEGNKAYARDVNTAKLIGGLSLNQNPQHEATAKVFVNAHGTYFKVLSEAVSGVHQLFVQPIEP
jgi:hypothetical protein